MRQKFGTGDGAPTEIERDLQAENAALREERDEAIRQRDARQDTIMLARKKLDELRQRAEAAEADVKYLNELIVQYHMGTLADNQRQRIEQLEAFLRDFR